MKINTAIVAVLSLLVCGYAQAVALRLTASKTITINASATKVWQAAKDFNDLNTWHPAVATDEIVEGKNNTVGAVRLLTLKGGGTIKERLLSHNPADNENDKTAIDTMSGVYQAGLDNLKKIAEAQ